MSRYRIWKRGHGKPLVRDLQDLQTSEPWPSGPLGIVLAVVAAVMGSAGYAFISGYQAIKQPRVDCIPVCALYENLEIDGHVVLKHVDTGCLCVHGSPD